MSEIDVPGHLQAILAEVRKVAREQQRLTACIEVLSDMLDERAPDTAKEAVEKTRMEWEVLNTHRARLDELEGRLMRLEARADNRE